MNKQGHKQVQLRV